MTRRIALAAIAFTLGGILAGFAVTLGSLSLGGAALFALLVGIGALTGGELR